MPNHSIRSFDQKQRALDKQHARLKDAQALKDGTERAQDQAKRNGFFSSLDLSNVTILAIGAREIAQWRRKNGKG